MWFVFPQIAGLGYSSMSQRYAIRGRAEAAAYANHPVLGARLRECTTLVNNIEGRTVHQIFGSPDDVKFRSSMTLFSLCASDPEVFDDRSTYFDGAIHHHRAVVGQTSCSLKKDYRFIVRNGLA
jgi:uncharacterized protein (DUF1810 family)